MEKGFQSGFKLSIMNSVLKIRVNLLFTRELNYKYGSLKSSYDEKSVFRRF